MKPKTKKEQPVATYPERAAKLRNQAVALEWQEIERKLAEYDAKSAKRETELVAQANEAREIGLLLQTVSGGHEQVEFGFFNDHCPKSLKEKLTHARAKSFVAIANRLPEAAKSVQDLMPVMLPVMVSAELFELPERTEGQNPNPLGPTQHFFKTVMVLSANWRKLLEQEPMENWHPKDREQFLTATAWWAEARARAEGLEAKK